MPFDPDLDRLADRFVTFVHRETGLPVIACDETGTIRRAVVKSRIGAFHPGAQRIARGEAREVLVTAEMERADPRTREGCNSPIVVGDRIAGSFGVAGPIEVARPLAHVAAGVLAGWMRELVQRRQLRKAADEVLSAVDALSARVELAAREEAASERRLSAAAARASERAGRTDEILRAVQGVASQSRTLAINGGVEASRAGDLGRAFAVVAREMLTLAETARASAERIQDALGGVRAGLVRHADAMHALSASGQDQLAAMRALASRVAGLRERVDALAATFDQDAERARSADAAAVDERFWSMAERFIRFVAAETGQGTILCDATGTIVRATDRARLGKPHAGARRILDGDGLEAVVSAEEAAANPNVREGASSAIVLGGRKVGTFGITGPLEVTRPLARIAASVLATRVNEHRSHLALDAAAAEIFAAVDALSGRTARAAEDARALQAVMAGAARDLDDRLAATAAAGDEVQQVAQQTRIISVNGAVEAAGSETRQRVFGNVARDMVRLADDTHRAGKQIVEALADIRDAVAALAAAGALLESAARSRAVAAREIVATVGALRGTLDGVLRSFEDADAAPRAA